MISKGQESVIAFASQGAGKRVIHYGRFLLAEHNVSGEMRLFSLAT